MTVTTKNKADLVAGMTAGIQALASGYVDFEVGSILLAIVEGVADVVLWLQGIFLVLLAVTRLATSTGSDADSFVADFSQNLNFSRLAATPATTPLTFARFSDTSSTYVPVGATVQTPDGTEVFAVTTDPTNPAYSATAGGVGVPGYVMAISTASVIVPSQATTPGAASNVLAGTLTVITSSIPGVDTVTNAANATGGADAESDPAMRARFVNFINSLQSGTPLAVAYAVTQLGPTVTCSTVENYTYAGAYLPGFMYFVVNDGSGDPPGSLLTAATAAINAVRPVTSTYAVYGPTVLEATVSLTITAAPGYTKANLEPIVQAAIEAFIAAGNGGTTGWTLAWSRIAQVAYDATPGVANVTAVLLNSGTADLVASNQQVIEPASVTVS